MKKLISMMLVLALTVGVLCVNAFAEQTGNTPNGDPYYASNQQVADGKINFTAPNVTINPRSHAMYQVKDKNGNSINATLSSDGHFYIVPTNEGTVLVATGW